MPVAVTPEAVEAKVIETIASFGPEVDQVTRGATFEALDVDSLDLVELAQVIEDEFGIALKGDDVKDIKTVGEAGRPGGEPGLMSRRVVITGVGAVTPLGMGARTLFERWAAGEVGIADGEAPCTWFDPVARSARRWPAAPTGSRSSPWRRPDEAVADAGWVRRPACPARRSASAA